MAQVLDHKEAKAEAKAAKARAKSMRPWFKKKRWWLAIAVVAIIGMAAASGGSSKSDSTKAAAGAPASSGVRSMSSNGSNPPEADVTVKSCATDEFGYMEAKVEVVNHSSKASNYSVEVAFEGNGGTVQLGTGAVLVSGLEPGQTTLQDANPFEKSTGAFTCRVTSVDRFAA